MKMMIGLNFLKFDKKITCSFFETMTKNLRFHENVQGFPIVKKLLIWYTYFYEYKKFCVHRMDGGIPNMAASAKLPVLHFEDAVQKGTMNFKRKKVC